MIGSLSLQRLACIQSVHREAELQWWWTGSWWSGQTWYNVANSHMGAVWDVCSHRPVEKLHRIYSSLSFTVLIYVVNVLYHVSTGGTSRSRICGRSLSPRDKYREYLLEFHVFSTNTWTLIWHQSFPLLKSTALLYKFLYKWGIT